MEKDKIHDMEYMVSAKNLRPHFVFNVLNQMKCEAILHSENEIGMIDDFAKYMRYILECSEAKGLVTLQKEIQFVKAYARMEQIRFSDVRVIFPENLPDIDKERSEIFQNPYSFDTVQNWKEESLKMRIYPFMIKELVHNGIHHGILPNGGGSVSVRIQNNEKDIHILVEDDGVGMSKGQIQRVCNHSESTIYRIDRQCKRLGGRLWIDTKEKQGTKVEIVLKKEVGCYENNFCG